MTPLEFAAERDAGSTSWERARPRDALLERTAWNQWLVTLPGGDTHRVRLERDHGAFVGSCDCDGFEYHDGPCAHLCTLRKAAFINTADNRGRTVRILDAAQERAEHSVESIMADGRGRQ